MFAISQGFVFMYMIDKTRNARPIIPAVQKAVSVPSAPSVETASAKAGPQVANVAAKPPAPVSSPATPERKAQIDNWLNENATAEKSVLVLFNDQEGGKRVGQALRGESDLGQLTTAERDALAESAVQAWRNQPNLAVRSENIREAVAEVRHDPVARAALARGLAGPELAAQEVYAQGGSIMTSVGDGAVRHQMLQQALQLDSTAVIGAAEGVEPQLASILPHMPATTRQAVWSVLADRDRLDPAQAERMATAAFMFEDGKALTTQQGQSDFAAAIANARAPGNSDADRIRREQMTRDLETALADRDTRNMLFAQETPPELRVWALDHIAGDGRCCRPADALKGGWESEGISKSYAEQATEAYRARGSEPQELSGEALRNIVGQAMGMSPDALPQDGLSEAWLERGLENRFYSNSPANAALDKLADQIRAVGGEAAQVTVVPVTVTSKDQGAAVVPVFRVEDPQGGPARFVDHSGRSYRDLNDWDENSTLPKGKMTYAQGLDLSASELTHRNTPGVVDSFAEGFGQVVDAVAMGAGIVAGVALIAGTGGTATPLVVAGASALWMTGRAGQELYDKATHGEDILDLSNPSVRGNWLEVAAGVLSVGAIGGALKLGAAGAKITPGMARMVAGVSYAADAADALTILDQSVQLGQNWDKMSGADRAGALLNIAFWGGMGVASHVAGTRARNFADLDADLRVRGMAGGDVPLQNNTNLAPGGIRIAYDLDASGKRASNIQIETGPGAIDPQALDRHIHIAEQMQAAGGLRDRLNRLLTGKQTPEPGSAAWEAWLEIAKIETEVLTLANAATDGSLDPATLATRQRELDQALIREQARLETGGSIGQGFVAAPRSLDDLLTYYTETGDITRGIPATVAAIDTPLANASAHIDYGSVNAAGQAQGINAVITKDILNTGTGAKGAIRPPGYVHGDDNHSRGHLLAKMLGGSGSDPRNLVMLYQRDTNSPVMRDFERNVYDAVAAGEVVNYQVTPIYEGGVDYPVSVAFQARGSDGLDVSITINNIDKGK
ncbi:MAG: DUF4781 domain-containing protein [Paracoccus sp. (in: a-proteobacteria)]|uniref:DUF4781 domain-containing protein n=1 Tax=Paracoccus sp. TaxID=267 RepID=UPI0026E01276|nr:DUF4781 domain-containing protein [Paracoccus sp. (in: a-proteobacteria)]MDO5621552.1 DUF4781 domain-containing protein [Paracoccus sp. (in: a-proteobacteria)]